MTYQILTQEHLRFLMDYDPDTGVFTRKVKVKNQPAGTIVGTSGTRGYLQCSIDGKPYKLHRLAWLYVHGAWPADQIDHINHNTSDNRLCNLRVVSSAQNHQNRARKTNSSSGYLGVTWHKRERRWQAQLEVNGKAIHLGSYQDLGLAIAARKQAELKFHPHRPT
jgi:hypothetical protein